MLSLPHRLVDSILGLNGGVEVGVFEPGAEQLVQVVKLTLLSAQAGPRVGASTSTALRLVPRERARCFKIRSA
jgi:hypothetical protein